MACKHAYEVLSDAQSRRALDLANGNEVLSQTIDEEVQRASESSGHGSHTGRYVQANAWAYEPAPAAGRRMHANKRHRNDAHGVDGMQRGAAGAQHPGWQPQQPQQPHARQHQHQQQRWSELEPLLQAYLLDVHGVHMADFASLQVADMWMPVEPAMVCFLWLTSTSLCSGG